MQRSEVVTRVRESTYTTKDTTVSKCARYTINAGEVGKDKKIVEKQKSINFS
jgi:hypothetical protein